MLTQNRYNKRAISYKAKVRHCSAVVKSSKEMQWKVDLQQMLSITEKSLTAELTTSRALRRKQQNTGAETESLRFHVVHRQKNLEKN